VNEETGRPRPDMFDRKCRAEDGPSLILVTRILYDEQIIEPGAGRNSPRQPLSGSSPSPAFIVVPYDRDDIDRLKSDFAQSRIQLNPIG